VTEAMTWESVAYTLMCDVSEESNRFSAFFAAKLWLKLHSAFGGRGAPISPFPAAPSSYAPWPKFDPALLVEDILEIPVQVNGKLRDVIQVPSGASQADLETAAKLAEKVKPFLDGKTIKKIIVVSKKLVNIVVT